MKNKMTKNTSRLDRRSQVRTKGDEPVYSRREDYMNDVPPVEPQADSNIQSNQVELSEIEEEIL
jgi:hypothetical protein